MLPWFWMQRANSAASKNPAIVCEVIITLLWCIAVRVRGGRGRAVLLWRSQLPRPHELAPPESISSHPADGNTQIQENLTYF